ncbi:putative TetR family transcriptional regulator [Gordonia araii NBRC 100433]|uniref:Putative TetR family transcriptional regulator n=1 Tax=Gordonia araii NBRC 100433 TaxID=1073574 RepID=G7GXZ7_9ACTN|nr:TetR/AcrR family transcriptional regulator [Gordonia araii]NNG98084.1 TetR/AcrR family transcriptional regulator [Gordonia araii NBRC 100433]GAB08472.1 putative TetR family transcriptional regulator [Gordonia araii NBRC 100433]
MGGDGSKVETSEASPRPRRGRPTSVGLADERRAQLTKAAYEVFVEYPYEEAPVSEIARRAGVGQGTLYRYVDGKRELLDLVIDWCVDQLMTAIEPETLIAAVEAPDSTALRKVIDDLGDRLYALVDANPGLLRILTIQGGAVDRELRYRVTGIYNTVDSLIIRVLTEATERGWMDLDEREIAVIARALPALGLPGLVLVLTGDKDEPAKRAEYVTAASDLARFGLLGVKGSDE